MFRIDIVSNINQRTVYNNGYVETGFANISTELYMYLLYIWHSGKKHAGGLLLAVVIVVVAISYLVFKKRRGLLAILAKLNQVVHTLLCFSANNFLGLSLCSA